MNPILHITFTKIDDEPQLQTGQPQICQHLCFKDRSSIRAPPCYRPRPAVQFLDQDARVGATCGLYKPQRPEVVFRLAILVVEVPPRVLLRKCHRAILVSPRVLCTSMAASTIILLISFSCMGSCAEPLSEDCRSFAFCFPGASALNSYCPPDCNFFNSAQKSCTLSLRTCTIGTS